MPRGTPCQESHTLSVDDQYEFPRPLDRFALAFFICLALAVPLIFWFNSDPDDGLLPLVAVVVVFWPQSLIFYRLYRWRRKKNLTLEAADAQRSAARRGERVV